jgi:uncharacterized membrane protein YoaK (UPF0700 family)
MMSLIVYQSNGLAVDASPCLISRTRRESETLAGGTSPARLEDMPSVNVGRLALLAWIAGEIDAFGYLLLDKVLVSHMSGNTAVLAAALAQRNWHEAAHRALPIPFFVAGAACGAALVEAAEHTREVARALLAEALLLMFVAGVQWITGGAAVHSSAGSTLLILLLAGAMGIQNAALTHPGIRGTHSTHITGPLTDVTADVVHLVAGRTADVRPARVWQSGARVVGFAVGAFSGAALFLSAAVAPPLVGAAALVAIAAAELRVTTPV